MGYLLIIRLRITVVQNPTRAVSASSLGGIVKHRLNQSIGIILLIALFFLVSCASTGQKQTDLGDGSAYNKQGIACARKGQYDQAILYFNMALELNSKDIRAYYHRGHAYADKGQYDRAISDYTKALELNPGDARVCNSLAWLLATAKKPAFRKGEKAVELALKACELSGWKNPGYLDTLAAAYARTGDFENAVKWQEKAFMSPKIAMEAGAQQRLRLYRERKPWPD